MKKLAFWVFAAAVAACAFGAWEAVRVPANGESGTLAQVGKVAAILGSEETSASLALVRPRWEVQAVVTTNANETTLYQVTWIADAGTTNAVTNAMSYADLRNAQAAYAGWAADTNLTVSLATNVEVEVWAVTTNLVPVAAGAETNTLAAGDFVLPGDFIAAGSVDDAVVILEH
ncbi:MAG: hypothetical protein J6Y19_07025 [Kiritimatiellae bacterium]|nr:hypothetical protein [Kiritimatiellia bacterium]